MSFLDDYVTLEEVPEDNCVWLKYQIVYDADKTADTLADEIAALIIETRCPPVIYNQWVDAHAGATALTDIQKQALRVYIKPSIGLPDASATANELQGAVAEYFWYEIVRSREESEELVDIHKPSLRVTEPGGDGLVIYQADYESYIFRLWEVKKHAISTSATSKITKASKQLKDNGAEYLAKLSKVEQERDREYPGLSKYYAELVPKWLESSSDAHAGVSLSKDDVSSVTSTPIGTMKTHLPGLNGERQLSAIIISMPDFVEFTKKVQASLWKDI